MTVSEKRAFLMAPLVVPSLLFALGLFVGDPYFGLIFFGFSAVFAYVFLIILGYPTHRFLKSISAVKAIHYAGAGLLLSAVPAFLVFVAPRQFDLGSWSEIVRYLNTTALIAITVAACVVTSLTFWGLARPDLQVLDH